MPRRPTTTVAAEVTAEMSPAETAGMPSAAVLRTDRHNYHQHEADYKRPGLHETPRESPPLYRCRQEHFRQPTAYKHRLYFSTMNPTCTSGVANATVP